MLTGSGGFRIGKDAVGLCLYLVQLLLDSGVGFELCFGFLFFDLFIDRRKLCLPFFDQFFRGSKLFIGFFSQRSVMGFPFIHKFLDRCVKQEVKSSGQNRKV